MGVTKGELFKLEEEKKAIERDLEEAFLVLTNNNVGMDDPLVDAEDFPRSDISVYEVRHARAKIIRLQNDLKSVTGQIAKSLELFHQSHPVISNEEEDTNRNSQPIRRRRLAKIELIEEGSPANTCGLLNGDYIVEIGDVTEETFKGLEDIANAVKLSENYYMKVVIERDDRMKRINLKPRKWAGPNKGLLGCKITPVPH